MMQINKKNYKNFEVFEINKLPARSYFIPFSSKTMLSKAKSVELDRYYSDKVQVLSGEWDFKYYPTVKELPDNFDTNIVKFDKIKVPHTWQRTGYEPPFYLNTRYQFKLNPPKFPTNCSVGVYKKSFNINNLNQRYVLSFLGVAPGLDLYVNGKFVGFAECSHNTHEFDISSFVQAGVNEIVVVVFKYNNGTYLECQDMFRENGIFRDVLLFETNKNENIYDYEIKTVKNNGKYNLEIFIKGNFNEKNTISISILDKNENVLWKKELPAVNELTVKFNNLEIEEWSAEKPVIYNLELSLLNNADEVEFIRDIVGFKTVKIEREVFKVNEQPIKILGVNRHDTCPVNGYAMTAEQLLNDVISMKKNNVNAARTSHYPPDPIFLFYCDIYGLYVIDEADIETHGCGHGSKPDYGLISHDKKWGNRYVDRVSSMFMRDKNRPSIIMWSLGNEAHGYNNHDLVYKYLKSRTSIPVHYEGVIHTKRWRYDVTSEMYEKYCKVKRIAERKARKKFYGAPYFLCEYMHAMGFGPGGLHEMVELFFSAPILLGGCVWEWKDHAVYHENGLLKYTYGGDHGEFIHDGNFCVDGLNYPDGTPHTGLKNMKIAYSPFRVKKAGDSFEFLNRNFFKKSDYVDVNYIIEQDGEEIGKGNLNFDLAPQTKASFTLPLPKEKHEKDFFVMFIYTNKINGQEIAKEQIIINQKSISSKIENIKHVSSIVSCDKFINTPIKDGEIVLDKTSGNIIKITKNDKDLLNMIPESKAGIYDNLFRAPLDNDRNFVKENFKLGLDNLTSITKNIDIFDSTFFIKKILKNSKGKTLFTVNSCCKVCENGTIILRNKLSATPLAKNILLQSIGWCFEMPVSFNRVEYFGRGPDENLTDFTEHAPIRKYSALVKDMHEPYIKPQCNHYHTENRTLIITDENGAGLEINALGKPFNFAVHDYTQQNLTAATHQEKIKRGGTTFVNIDAFAMGTGSNSCGPLPQKEFLLPSCKNYSYGIVIKIKN